MDKLTIAYITSSSFSGSTLLTLILNAHPSIGTISEFDALGYMARDLAFRCSCGAIIDECPFFVELRKSLTAKGVPFEIRDMDLLLRLSKNRLIDALLTDKIPLVNSSRLEQIRDRVVNLIPVYRREIERIYKRNELFIRELLELQNASIFLDANKNPHRMLFLSRRFDLKSVYIFKNGIAGVYSYLKSAKRDNMKRTVQDATRRWFLEQLVIARCLKRLGSDRYIQVSYSELCQNTEKTIQRICEFLQIEKLSLEDFATTPHHVVGNAMRLGDFSEIRERMDWRENVSSADIEVYRKVASKYLPRLYAENPEIAGQIWT